MYEITDIEDLSKGERIIKEVNGRSIAVFNVEEEYYAMLNYCQHAGGPLCEGELTTQVNKEDERLESDSEALVKCPWHGWRFNIDTGMNVDSEKYGVPTFEVEIKDGKILVDA
jgi:nitrite reductase/ring-hydroxylating ferredoxin subunit